MQTSTVGRAKGLRPNFSVSSSSRVAPAAGASFISASGFAMFLQLWKVLICIVEVQAVSRTLRGILVSKDPLLREMQRESAVSRPNEVGPARLLWRGCIAEGRWHCADVDEQD